MDNNILVYALTVSGKQRAHITKRAEWRNARDLRKQILVRRHWQHVDSYTRAYESTWGSESNTSANTSVVNPFIDAPADAFTDQLTGAFTDQPTDNPNTHPRTTRRHEITDSPDDSEIEYERLMASIKKQEYAIARTDQTVHDAMRSITHWSFLIITMKAIFALVLLWWR